MSDDPRIQELLEQILESGSSPEDVCAAAEHRDLLPQVRQRLRRLRSVEAQIEDLFPPSDAGSVARRPRAHHPDGDLPRIPGYEVESVLGRGGMGVVYKARHLKLHRPVALKMLLAGVYASASDRTRFMHEAEAVARLTHAHVVQVHDVGDFEGRPYYTMEFVEGGTLAEKLAGVPRPAREAAALVATLAEAVHLAHRAGIVHRDLKPANILLTADGTPKISDYGLARWINQDANVTLTGVRVGTPSYMAPEQAMGKAAAIGPATDVYSLGAILYEMLTGRPPFRAETASETERQLIAQDPVSPSRLNAKVPRDLETICLKCLHKDRHRRYESAAALADDIHRFERGEPITARPIGYVERAAKWVRRHPTLAMAMLCGLLLSVVLLGGGVWLALQRADLAHAVDADLKDVTALQRQARWAEARAALDRAEARLGRGGPDELRERFAEATTDLDVVMTLDNIRLSRVTSGQLVVYRRRANDQYAAIFREARIGTVNDPADVVAARLEASAVRSALIAALDDWAVCAADGPQRDWVLDVARRADGDPQGWRDRALDGETWSKPAVLAEVAEKIPVEHQSLSLLLAIGDRLRSFGTDATTLLRRVQKEHPDDFWANLVLGNALLFRAPGEARGYYRTALGSRPNASVGYCAVGDTLRLQGSVDEAVHYYHRSLELDPNYARGYTNLGLALESQGKLDDAIDNYHKSLAIDAEYAWSYYNLGNALRAKGQLDDAMAQYQKAMSLDPGNPSVLGGIRTVLARQGHAQEVWEEWREIIQTDPPKHEDWWGYAELSLFLGKEDEYRHVRQALLRHFAESEDPMITEKVARACLMLPPDSAEELRKATVLADRAVAAMKSTDDWLHPYFLFAQALAEYRQGHFDNALALVQGEASKALSPAPRLLMAMVYQAQGDAEAARKTLAAAVKAYDWRPAHADSRDAWMRHILRREAEAMILAHGARSESAPAQTKPSQ